MATTGTVSQKSPPDAAPSSVFNPFYPMSFFAPLISALNQPILPLSISTVYNVTDQNSSSPDTERKILAKDSYGRQLGKLMDAVAILIEQEKKTKKSLRQADIDKLDALLALRKEIEQTKVDSAASRLDAIKADLLKLKSEDRPRYDKFMAAFRE
ncbi:hypothetical protein ACO0LO_00150 [Undibacterium sp. TJN25]|uniref:hypothetical protein n=1 Tax=Undibacterium sp. TJN25 TaxID=3413056 RepID=UPI003BF0CE83